MREGRGEARYIAIFRGIYRLFRVYIGYLGYIYRYLGVYFFDALPYFAKRNITFASLSIRVYKLVPRFRYNRQQVVVDSLCPFGTLSKSVYVGDSSCY